MTSDGISRADWERVHELALEIVNAADEDADRHAREALRAYLRELRARYGERPSILATEADYADSFEESKELLVRAFRLATDLSDTANLKEVSLSLADLCATYLHDLPEARRWLMISRQWLDPANTVDWEEYDALDQTIESGLK